MTFTLLALSCLLGLLLSKVIPGGVEKGVKYCAPTEAGFMRLLEKRGLSHLVK